MSKGSSRRPKVVTAEKFGDNWDNIFKKPLNNQKDSTCSEQKKIKDGKRLTE